MGHIHFPSQYTEEEEALQKKYQKLKRKKKALQQLKAPKPEPSPIQNPLKCSSEAKHDAKEVAKKLLKSGAISAIKVENKERQGFKRPKTLERRRSGPEKLAGTLTGYQPFSSSQQPEECADQISTPSPPSRPAFKSRPSLYESFVPRKMNDPDPDRDGGEGPSQTRPEKHKQGHTIYVNGEGVTEDILRSAFAPVGNIFNISMELDKNCGFVTFDSTDSAAKAIREVNLTEISNVKLRVSLARRQPTITAPADAGVSNQKTTRKETRKLVVYDDIL